MLHSKFNFILGVYAFVALSAQNVYASHMDAYEKEFGPLHERTSLKGRQVGVGKLSRFVDYFERKKIPVKELDLSDNFLDAAASMSVRYLLQTAPSLKTLNLENNKLNSYALRDIARGLKKNKGLKKLNVKNNPFSMTLTQFKELVGENRVKDLEIDFPSAPQPEGLSLVEDPDDDLEEGESSSGSEDFSEEEDFDHEKLRALLVSGNLKGQNMDGDMLAHCVQWIDEENLNLTFLDLSENHLDLEASGSLRYLIQTQSSLEALNLENNKLNDLALSRIARGLKKNEGLKSLNLQRNPFTMDLKSFKKLIGQDRVKTLDIHFTPKEISKVLSPQ